MGLVGVRTLPATKIRVVLLEVPLGADHMAVLLGVAHLKLV